MARSIGLHVVDVFVNHLTEGLSRSSQSPQCHPVAPVGSVVVDPNMGATDVDGKKMMKGNPIAPNGVIRFGDMVKQ